MHKDLTKEQERVHRVIKVINDEKTRLAEQVEEKSEKQRQQLKESKEIKISQGSSESVWESSAELRAFEQELMIRNNELQNSNERVAVLEKMQDEPYFGRIDYHDEYGNETIYIGIGSLFEKDENLIVDWRSPIASLYYEGSKGEKVKLMIADQPMTYGVDLKRQFLIRQAEIIRMMDTDNVMGDPYLLEVLEGPSSYQMGTVVSTLQKEQNQIVRETKAAVTLIEGVAGSGKTVVLMQKIAYLLYAFRDQLKSEEVVLFSPNKIFQEYVSQVLPALGELNVGNTTFSEFMERKVTGFSLRADQEDSLAKVTVLKGSLAFYEALQKYGALLKKRYLKFSDIRFRGDIILSEKEIESAFYSIESQGSLASKLDILKRHLLQRVERIQQSQKGKPWVEKEMIAMSDMDLYRYEKETHNQKAMEEAMTADILEDAFEPIVARIEALAFIRYKNQYIHFLRAVPKLLSLDAFGLDEDEWRTHIAVVAAHMAEKSVLLEDLDAYYSLRLLLKGPSSDMKYQYICLDEVQDFSPFQLQMLQHAYPSARFILSGDLNQNILNRRLSFDDLRTIFSESTFRSYRLLTSYRSTNEIVRFSESFIEGEKPEGTYIRSGKKPEVLLTDDGGLDMDYIKQKVDASVAAGMRLAFISRNAEDAERISQELSAVGIDFKLVQQDTDNSHHPVLIMPARLAKGLEFDVVFAICHYPAKAAQNEMQILYTICTRAMHELYLTVSEKEAGLVERVDPDYYDVRKM